MGSTKRKWIKVNFDGAINKESFRSGSGLVAIDSHGNFLVSWSTFHENVPSAFTAEALPSLEATKMGLALGFKCNSAHSDSFEKSAFIRDIKSFGEKFHDFQFRHVSRRASTTAHDLATKALRNGRKVFHLPCPLRILKGFLRIFFKNGAVG